MGKYIIHIDGKYIMRIDGKYIICIDGKYIIHINGKYIIHVDGKYIIRIDGKYIIRINGKYTLVVVCPRCPVYYFLPSDCLYEPDPTDSCCKVAKCGASPQPTGPSTTLHIGIVTCKSQVHIGSSH